MRVYLPATLPIVRAALDRGEIGPPPVPGFAVTPALREWYAEGDLEELEYAALTAAARASLRLLGADPAAPRRRVVLAAEVADAAVAQLGEGEPGAVSLPSSVPLARVVSAHVDDAEAADTIAAAVDAVAAADTGDDDARFTVDEAEGFELLWFATQELPDLVAGG